MGPPHPTLPADPVGAYEALEGGGALAVTERDLVAVRGPEAGRYLQGQLSQDVVALVGPSAWSLLLDPGGKVEAWVRLHRRADDDYLVDVDAGHGDAVAARLRRFLLRTDAAVSDPRPVRTLAVRASEPVMLDEVPAGWLRGVLAGPGVVGVDLLDEPGSGWAPEGVPVVPGDALERHRIAHGVPAMGVELTPDTIPAEAGRWLIEASVSFTKGCYTGQELVARIDSRGGNVPRPVRLLVLDEGGGAAPGDEVRLDGAAVGSVTSATPSLSAGHPALALAPLGRAVPVGAVVEVRAPSGPARATVIEPPFHGHGAR